MTLALAVWHWTDSQGRGRVTLARTLAGATSIENDLNALSQAQIDWCTQGVYETYTVTPGGGQYPSVNDWVALLFQTTAGTQVRLTLPAPSTSIFQADGQTVNPAMISTLITDCVGNLTDDAGNVVVSF